MKTGFCGSLAAIAGIALCGVASAQTYSGQPQGEIVYQSPLPGQASGTYTAPGGYQTQPGYTAQPGYAQPGYTVQPGYPAPPEATYLPGTTYAPGSGPAYTPSTGATYGAPTTVFPGFPQPQPYLPPTGGYQPQPPVVIAPPTQPPAPSNPKPVNRDDIPDTDAWTYSMPRFYPAIRACLRNVTTPNPVVANISERRNATVMLIGQGGSTTYQVCRTGLRGTSMREVKQERGLPPAFYAPVGTSFTVAPERPFQPVVDTNRRLLGWIVRTTPVRLDLTGGRGFDGQFIRPVQVNPEAQ